MNPTSFTIGVYNASRSGEWIDLINHENNKTHTGVLESLSEPDFNNIGLLNFHFYNGYHCSDYSKIRIKINGEERIAALYLSEFQFQRDVIQIQPRLKKLTEFKIFLPASTFSCQVSGVSDEKYPCNEITLEKINQYAIRIKNRTNSAFPVDLLNPEKLIAASKIDFEEIFSVGGPAATLHNKPLDHLKIYSSAHAAKEFVCANAKENKTHTFLSPIDHMAFQNQIQTQKLPKGWEEFITWTFTLEAYEDILLYFISSTNTLS